MRISVAIILIAATCICEAVSRKSVPPGMNPELFPKQTFDENAPFCQSEREPCGFYSFSLSDRTSFKWIKSWCHCMAGYSCVYERTDMKVRVYRHSCVADSDLGPDILISNEKLVRKQVENEHNKRIGQEYDRLEGRDRERNRQSTNRQSQHPKNSRRRKIFDETNDYLD